MTTKDFAYTVRSVRGGVARLVAHYDKDFAQRPAAILIHSDAFTPGDDVTLAFVPRSASLAAIMGT